MEENSVLDPKDAVMQLVTDRFLQGSAKMRSVELQPMEVKSFLDIQLNTLFFGAHRMLTEDAYDLVRQERKLRQLNVPAEQRTNGQEHAQV